MAPPLVIPDLYGQLTIVINTGGTQTAEMVFGIGTGGDDAQDVADALGAVMVAQTNMPAFLPTTSILQSIKTRSRNGLSTTVGEYVLAEPGLASGTTQAPQVAILLHKNTGVAGRANRGRTYFPQPAEIRVDNFGNLDATAITTYTTLAEDIHGWIVANTLGHYILHTDPLIDPGPPPVYGVAGAPTQVTGMSVDPVVATQRRRIR